MMGLNVQNANFQVTLVLMRSIVWTAPHKKNSIWSIINVSTFQVINSTVTWLKSTISRVESIHLTLIFKPALDKAHFLMVYSVFLAKFQNMLILTIPNALNVSRAIYLTYSIDNVLLTLQDITQIWMLETFTIMGTSD